MRGLKHAPDSLWQHGTIHVFIPQAVREKIVDKQTDNAVTDIYTNNSKMANKISLKLEKNNSIPNTIFF